VYWCSVTQVGIDAFVLGTCLGIYDMLVLSGLCLHSSVFWAVMILVMKNLFFDCLTVMMKALESYKTG
jgi:hypothetical protein